jgi:uncharacterized damage-inducible protein DinB
MAENILVKLFEHNNWANKQILQACSALSDEQLDSEPQSATQGSIRSTLTHFVSSQRGYLSLLTLPVEARPTTPVAFEELEQSVRDSGEALLALLQDDKRFQRARLQTRNGYHVEPWVVMVQIINHATEHREQIKSMLSALGVTPPEIDGWDYGLVTNSLVPMST